MRAKLETCLTSINEILLGKEFQVRLAVACILARGHLLLEDLPGMGKTTLSHTLATIMGLDFQRIQFTSDLLPGDVLGTSVFEQASGGFAFHPGPIFAELILADEINRATPKTQSALLEAMEEGQVTCEGVTRPLPSPFFVIATQNPLTQEGTFPLPESQLDRFLMRLSLGYPSHAAEKALLLGTARRDLLPGLQPVLTREMLLALQQAVAAVQVTEVLADYILRLVEATRTQMQVGLSPRGTLALLGAAKAWAYLAGRDYVIPEDVQTVFPAVAGHRILGQAEQGHEVSQAIQRLLHDVPAL